MRASIRLYAAARGAVIFAVAASLVTLYATAFTGIIYPGDSHRVIVLALVVSAGIGAAMGLIMCREPQRISYSRMLGFTVALSLVGWIVSLVLFFGWMGLTEAPDVLYWMPVFVIAFALTAPFKPFSWGVLIVFFAAAACLRQLLIRER